MLKQYISSCLVGIVHRQTTWQRGKKCPVAYPWRIVSWLSCDCWPNNTTIKLFGLDWLRLVNRYLCYRAVGLWFILIGELITQLSSYWLVINCDWWNNSAVIKMLVCDWFDCSADNTFIRHWDWEHRYQLVWLWLVVIVELITLLSSC